MRPVTADRLRVLLDGSALPPRPAGAGIYTLELAKALAARDDVDLHVTSPFDTGIGSWVRSPGRGPAWRSAWQQSKLPGAARDADADVIHGAHFAVPLRSSVPRVATIHDLEFYRVPRRYRRAKRFYYQALARLAKRAERIIVPSRVVAGDVIRYLGYPPERMRVVPEAPRRLPVTHGSAAVPHDPYLLCVGTAEPGKRAVDAIRALPLLPEKTRPRLVLAGNDGPLSLALRREAARLGVADRVTFTGYVADGDLGALFAGAVALVFPSLCEGFGLPPLEAMALGTPVIAARTPVLTEVLGDAAAFAPLRDPTAIATCIRRLVEDPPWRDELVARGRARAGEYSWERTAAETADVYREVAA